MQRRTTMKWTVAAGAGVLLAFAVPLVWAHFQVLIPSVDMVTAESKKTIHLNIVFTHPMEQGPIMNMAKPKCFGVLAHEYADDREAYCLQKSEFIERVLRLAAEENSSPIAEEE